MDCLHLWSKTCMYYYYIKPYELPVVGCFCPTKYSVFIVFNVIFLSDKVVLTFFFMENALYYREVEVLTSAYILSLGSDITISHIASFLLLLDNTMVQSVKIMCMYI